MTMKKQIIYFILLLIGVLLIQACNNDSTKGPKINNSQLETFNVKIHRYGKALAETDTANFLKDVSKLQDEFLFFLGDGVYTDEQLEPLYEYVTDTQLIYLSNKVMEIYPNVEKQEEQLASAFSRYHYFFPKKRIPEVYSYISNLFHEEPIIYDDSVVIIALDVYLGKNFDIYPALGIPQYKIRCMTGDNIAVDVMKKLYVSDLAPRSNQKTLVDRMIASGKMLYYLDAVLPEVPDSLKICYTTQQLEWMNNNKSNVWAFMVDNKLFYTADYKIQTKFIQDGPFTSGFTNNSPPRIGIWIGWQIVISYMEKHSEVKLIDLIQNTDNQAIFNQSGYKP